MAKKKASNGKIRTWLKPSNLIKITGWARDGLTNEDIAKNIGINPKTLYEWIKKYPEVKEALEKGKEVVDRIVENALYNKATGFTKVVNTTKVLNDGTVVRYDEEIYFPPDTTAAIFWLKNRKPADWRDKRDVEVSGEVNNPYKDLTTEELRKLAMKDDS